MYQENKANSFLIEHFKVDTHNLVIKKKFSISIIFKTTIQTHN